MAVPSISHVARQVPDTGQAVGQGAGQVPTLATSGHVLAKIPITSQVIPSVQGLVIGQGLSTNQSPFRAHLLPTHQVLVKGQIKPRSRSLLRKQIRPRGQIQVTSADPVRVNSHILGQVSGQVKPATYVPGLRQIPTSAECQMKKTLGIVSGQVVGRELFVFPGSHPKVQASAGGKLE
jgi:2-keto-3-deoxy-galactonokinase